MARGGYFISGLFSTIEEQDKFLDYVLQHNLPLYIECINSKMIC